MEVWKFRSKQPNVSCSYTFVRFSWWERRHLDKIMAKHPNLYHHPYWSHTWILPSKKADELELLKRKPPLPKRRK